MDSPGGLSHNFMFFDAEARGVATEEREARSKELVDLVKQLNYYQTREQPPPRQVGDKAVEQPQFKFHVVGDDLETATHAAYPQTGSFDHITSANRVLFEDACLLFCIPKGLSFGGGSSVSGAGPQERLHHAFLKSTRSRVENVLTAVYGRVYNDVESEVKLIPHNPSCGDLLVLIELRKAGLLPDSVAATLVGEALGADCSGLHGEKGEMKDELGEKDEDSQSQASSTLRLE